MGASPRSYCAVVEDGEAGITPWVDDLKKASVATKFLRLGGLRRLAGRYGRRGGTGFRLPSARLALVLFLQVSNERREIFDQRAAVHLLRARELLERLLPGLARAFLEHRDVLRAGVLVAVEVALVERTLVAGGVAQRLVELELDDE